MNIALWNSEEKNIKILSKFIKAHLWTYGNQYKYPQMKHPYFDLMFTTPMILSSMMFFSMIIIIEIYCKFEDGSNYNCFLEVNYHCYSPNRGFKV